jgi:predicted ATPase/DNA-binding SARP family transcriptional activator
MTLTRRLLLRPVQLCVFGPVAAVGPSGTIELTRARERSILATLALFHGRAVSIDRLVDAVWRDEPPRRPEGALQTYVLRLRTALGAGVVETRPDGYALAAEVVVDAELFETHANTDESVPRLRDALARWQGEPYADLGEWPPAELERERLAELRDHALERCLALEIDAGRSAGCIAELEAMVADKPLRERRWLLLMTALHRDGRVADALRTYQRARKAFAEELGIDPGPELRALEEQILLADIQAAVPSNLPRQLTSFVGRQRELAQLRDLVRDRSVITLTGVGGVGKTRLALETAAAVVADFPGGAWRCEFAPVADPAVVWETLATSLGLRPSPARRLRDVVLDYLALKRLLIVLDNCEHLLVPLGRVVEAIVQSCPAVVVLATSREMLGVAGEQVVAVSPLPAPLTDASVNGLAQSEVVRLFCDRARDVNGAFALTAGNAVAVAQLCSRLDGIPLAIELAAARVRSLSPEELVARLGQRFDLLTSARRSAPARHQALRNTLDWSYDLLSDTERRILNRLSVFAGGCDLFSAEAVLAGDGIAAKDVVDLLGQLVDKSLVEVDMTDGNSRSRLLETIRLYAHERLEASDDTARVRGRHLARYVDVAEQAALLRGRSQLERARALGPDTDNFRHALDWAVEAELIAEALRLSVPLTAVGWSTGGAATEWAETAIAIPGAAEHPLYPAAAAFAAIGAALRGDIDRAATLVAFAQDAQTHLGTHHLMVETAAAMLAMFRGNFDQAQHLAQRAVDQARDSQDPTEIAGALIIYAHTLVLDATTAAVAAEEAVQVSREVDSPFLLLHALLVLAERVVHDQPRRAHELVDAAADLARELGARQELATAIGGQAAIAITQHKWLDALLAATDGAEQHLQVGMSANFGTILALASMALAHLQLLEPAAILSGVTEARFPPAGFDRAWQARATAVEQLMVDALGATRTHELKAYGALLTVADAVAYLRNQRDQVLATTPEGLARARDTPATNGV